MFSARNKKYFLLLKEKNIYLGFSLIELVVVIVTMFLLFSVGMANVRDFQRRKVLEGAVLKLKGDLRMAQQIALSGGVGDTCSAVNERFTSVRVVQTDSSKYSIQVGCTDGPSEIFYDFGSYDISNDYPGIAISSFTVIFDNLGRGVRTESDISITLSNGSLNKTIVVTKGGEIK